jgi:predicted ArsR family transcriptional regulator
MKVEKGHLAYHLAILKAGGLVSFTYERKGRTSSRYSLTARGKEMYEELLKHS